MRVISYHFEALTVLLRAQWTEGWMGPRTVGRGGSEKNPDP